MKTRAAIFEQRQRVFVRFIERTRRQAERLAPHTGGVEALIAYDPHAAKANQLWFSAWRRWQLISAAASRLYAEAEMKRAA